MFKGITSLCSSEKTQKQNKALMQEQFIKDVLREDDRTKIKARSSSARARKALDMITETLEDYRTDIKTGEFMEKRRAAKIRIVVGDV